MRHMLTELRLSVLDQSTVVTGRSPDSSIRESLGLARHCEALGYHRYWCAEHHNSASQAGTAPEVLIAAIAATTRRIRVGSGRIRSAPGPSAVPAAVHRAAVAATLRCAASGPGALPAWASCLARVSPARERS